MSDSALPANLLSHRHRNFRRSSPIPRPRRVAASGDWPARPFSFANRSIILSRLLAHLLLRPGLRQACAFTRSIRRFRRWGFDRSCLTLGLRTAPGVNFDVWQHGRGHPSSKVEVESFPLASHDSAAGTPASHRCESWLGEDGTRDDLANAV